MPDELTSLFQGDLVFNGVNAVTGDYGQFPLTAQQLAQLIRGNPSPTDYRLFVDRQKSLSALTEVEDRLQRVTEAEMELRQREAEIRLEELRFKAKSETPWPVKPGAGDPSRIEDVGWAVVFPADMDPTLRQQIKEALGPLFDLRRMQAGDLFRVYEDGQGYRPGERKDQFFQRLEISAGLADPQEMPFYVMLVAAPDQIPFKFQYQLDVMRGVGRLDFGNNIQAYWDYAQSVVAAERGDVSLARRAAFFAPTNPGDKATLLSSQYLVSPVYENLKVRAPEHELDLPQPWDLVPPFIGEGKATRAQLSQLLGGDPTQMPALLLAASHGVEFPANHPQQLAHQGALLCQDWPGPGSSVQRGFYFAGEEVSPQADLRGMMTLFFACYGAGTPLLDQFAVQAFKVREKIAPRSFTAALPQRLLQQGMLAAVGHVERAWGYSFISPSGRLENQTFVTVMRSLMNGHPVGLATDRSFNMRYAELSSDLSADLEELQWDPNYMTDYDLSHRWTASNDARSYVIVGDPATRIPSAKVEQQFEAEADLGTIGVTETPRKAAFERNVEAVTPKETAPEEAAPEPTAAPEAPKEEGGVAEKAEGVASWAAAEAPPITPDVSTVASAQRAVPTVPYARAGMNWAEGYQEPPAVAFGLTDQVEKLRDSLRSFTSQLATSLGQAAEDIVTLDVKTYTAQDLTAIAEALEAGEKIEARLRALTRVGFDGDLQIYMPEKIEGSTEEALWAVHKAMVAEAQANRASFLARMAELATSLLTSLRMGP